MSERAPLSFWRWGLIAALAAAALAILLFLRGSPAIPVLMLALAALLFRTPKMRKTSTESRAKPSRR